MNRLLLASPVVLLIVTAQAGAQVVPQLGPSASIAAKLSHYSSRDLALYENMTVARQAKFDRLPFNRQKEYFTWSAPLRTYFWDLSPEQRQTWWSLTPGQRISIFRMDKAEREAAWNNVMDKKAGTEGNGSSGRVDSG